MLTASPEIKMLLTALHQDDFPTTALLLLITSASHSPPLLKGAAEDRVVSVTLHFGRTEITASARDENSGRDATLRTRFAQRSS